MFYPNQQALGKQLANRLPNYRNNDTIILCLKRSSLLSCIELAARLHAYIYILQYFEIEDPHDITRSLGAITAEKNFILNPDITDDEYSYINHNYMEQIEQRKQNACSKINAEQDLNPNFNPNVFNNRNILLYSDILKTTLPIQIALEMLKPFSPADIHGAFGNITAPVSDKMQLEANGATYMDMLTLELFDDDHFFDQSDNLTDEQKIKMANNISLYWV